LPTTRLGDGEHVAAFPVRATLAQSVVVPALKVTVPWLFGFVPLAEVTVAVKVSGAPYVLGLLPVVTASAVDVARCSKKFLPVAFWPAVRVTGSGLVPVLA
jgi:hypothetical protein